jgi:hypothetical protein
VTSKPRVELRLDVAHTGLSNRPQADALVQKTVGKPAEGSGSDGAVRILEFYFSSRREVLAARLRIKAAAAGWSFSVKTFARAFRRDSDELSCSDNDRPLIEAYVDAGLVPYGPSTVEEQEKPSRDLAAWFTTLASRAKDVIKKAKRSDSRRKAKQARRKRNR